MNGRATHYGHGDVPRKLTELASLILNLRELNVSPSMSAQNGGESGLPAAPILERGPGSQPKAPPHQHGGTSPCPLSPGIAAMNKAHVSTYSIRERVLRKGLTYEEGDEEGARLSGASFSDADDVSLTKADRNRLPLQLQTKTGKERTHSKHSQTHTRTPGWEKGPCTPPLQWPP